MTEDLDNIIRLAHDGLTRLLHYPPDIEETLAILDSIIYTAHNIKEQQDEGFEGYFGERIEEVATERESDDEEEHNPGYHVL